MRHTFANGQRRTPLIPQDIQTNGTIRVDVGVIDSGGKVDLGRLEGVVGREVEVEEKDTTGVR